MRNTYAGIRSVDPALIDVARAMGMTAAQRLFKVELPLGASVILAGLRTATVTCVGVATIAAAIGAGGLGELIFRGVASVDNGLVLAGAIPAALLALIADAAPRLPRIPPHHPPHLTQHPPRCSTLRPSLFPI